MQVPAIAYGGSQVPADEPSPDSVKIAESLVLIQFISDLFPDSGLLPKDPVAKAQIRFFLEFSGTKIAPVIHGFVTKGGPAEPVIEAYDIFQSLLPPVNQGKYLFGNKFTLADIAIAPFLGRFLVVALKHGLGKFDKDDGKRVWDTLQGPTYERLWQYIKDISERKSWKDTFDEASRCFLNFRRLIIGFQEYLLSFFSKRYAS
jgi:glutathione S-transferase